MNKLRVAFFDPSPEFNCVRVVCPAEGTSEEEARAAVPEGAQDVTVLTTDEMPQDRLFRAAWKLDDKKVGECPVLGKEVAHAIRRAMRAEEFAPHDDVVAKAIPGKAEAAEAARAEIRAKHADLQTKIDECKNCDEMRAALGA